MNNQRTIVIVLKEGGDFSFRDVELIVDNIQSRWKSEIRPRIICLWDKASEEYDLGKVTILPLRKDVPGTWSRIQLYSPEMEKYRPFLYVDLDTAIIRSIEEIFDLVINPALYITLEDFYQKEQLATGLVWFPANCRKLEAVWKYWEMKRLVTGNRMDYFLRKFIDADAYWQQLTDGIVDFKPRTREFVTVLPANAQLVCFHGKPRIFEAEHITWIKKYISGNLPRQ